MENDKNIKDFDVVLSSRVRISRNIASTKFPNILTKQEKLNVTNKIKESIKDDDFRLIYMSNLTKNEIFSFVEKNLISKEFANKEDGALIVNSDFSQVTMINEEDHLKIQAFKKGFNLDETYEDVSKFADMVNNTLEFSISDKYGYLTACPTNVGTALKASVMLHLPGLEKLGLLSNILEQASSIGLCVHGIYGEEFKSIGNMYIVSNQKTLGISEKEIINSLKAVISVIIEQERKAREILLKDGACFEDEIWRSYGIIKYSRVISFEEAIKLLSNIRLGISLKIIDDISLIKIAKIRTNVEPYVLANMYGSEFSQEKEDEIRSEYIRKEIENDV